MVDIKHDEINEAALPSKRKPVIDPEIDDDDDAKKPKLESSDLHEQKVLEDEHANANDADAAADVNAGDDDELNDAEKVEEEELNGGEEEAVAAVDRKGKGIKAEDKGKGKLIVDDEDSSDGEDDTSDDDSEFDDDSDLSDDSLTELDLQNILPAMTRRKVFLPDGSRFNEFHANDDSDSDSSDD